MYEVELKVRAANDRVRRRLEALDGVDATPLGTVVQEDTYYDAPHRNFAETDEALRIRREFDADRGDAADVATRLTYKGPLVEAESKTREEAETAVDDHEALQDVLSGLGFEPAAEVRKERERYAVGEFTVTLDAVEGLGEFVEVETEVDGDEAKMRRKREEAAELLERLGLDPAENIRTSYLGLLLSHETG